MSPLLMSSLLGCAPFGITSLETELVEGHESVIRVSWTTRQERETWIDFGLEGQLDRRSEISKGTEHEVLLLGLPELSEVSLAPSSGDVQGPAILIETGPSPAGFPKLETTHLVSDALMPGYILGCSAIDGPEIFVMDREGRLVWWWRSGDKDHVMTSCRPTPDGDGVTFGWYYKYLDVEPAEFRTITWDGQERASIPAEFAHHTFTQLEDGTLATLELDIRETETYGTVIGDQLVEISPDGSRRIVFSSWDHQTPEPNEGWVNWGIYTTGHDWSHANGVFYDAPRERYLVTFAHLDTLWAIDRWTGAQLADADRATFIPEDSRFHYAHAPRITEAGTLMLMSGQMGLLGENHIAEFLVDEDLTTFEEVWSYGRGEGIKALAMGEGRPLPNGNVLANFGSAGVLREVSAEGELLWNMSGGLGVILGPTWWLEELASPL